MISAARAVIDAAGPLGRHVAAAPSTSVGACAAPIAEMRDAAAAARRPRVLLAGLDAGTRAVARVALGKRVDVLEAPAAATSSAPARSARIS